MPGSEWRGAGAGETPSPPVCRLRSRSQLGPAAAYWKAMRRISRRAAAESLFPMRSLFAMTFSPFRRLVRRFCGSGRRPTCPLRAGPGRRVRNRAPGLSACLQIERPDEVREANATTFGRYMWKTLQARAGARKTAFRIPIRTGRGRRQGERRAESFRGDGRETMTVLRFGRMPWERSRMKINFGFSETRPGSRIRPLARIFASMAPIPGDAGFSRCGATSITSLPLVGSRRTSFARAGLALSLRPGSSAPGVWAGVPAMTLGGRWMTDMRGS